MPLGEEKKETKLRRWLHGQTPSSAGCDAALGGGWSWSLVDLVLGGLSSARLRMSRRWPLRAGGACGPSVPDVNTTLRGGGLWKGDERAWRGVACAGLNAKHSPGRSVETTGDAALPRGPEASRRQG